MPETASTNVPFRLCATLAVVDTDKLSNHDGNTVTLKQKSRLSYINNKRQGKSFIGELKGTDNQGIETLPI